MTKKEISNLLMGKGYRSTSEKLVFTSPKSFAVVEKSSFSQPSPGSEDNRGNRAQSLWKLAQHIIVADSVTDSKIWKGQKSSLSEKEQVLESWKLVVSKSPDLPSNLQRLYISPDGITFSQYDSTGAFIASGTLDDLIPFSSDYLGLEQRFYGWLIRHGVVSATQNYIDHLKAIGEKPAKHTKIGIWPGFYEDLTGKSPKKSVFDVKTLAEFDESYKELIGFFNSDTPNPAGFLAANFNRCFEYAHTSDPTKGDGKTTLNAFNRYRVFLAKISFDDILAAIRTKPFILLAGISGTGKSRMVRQLARGCCPKGSDLAKDPKDKTKPAGKPGNFEMIQVRPNWHDSTELMGYVTRITQSKEPEYVLTPFVKFLVKAWLHPETPFFLCLDEMNLAPVEQYFAEYLSVIETRRNENGIITTDVLVNFDVAQCTDASGNLSTDLFVEKTAKSLLEDYKPKAGSPVDPKVTALEAAIKVDKGIRIPPNLVVMGTVNMDETTCTFSRKVLDRAMSFELNEVDMREGLDKPTDFEFGSIAPKAATPEYLKPHEYHAAYESVCDKTIDYLETVNAVLDKTPFKIAYRSRDEILLYCVERTRGREDMLAQALDEATSMKILSRIEGDNQHVKEEWLADLKTKIGDELAKLPGFDKEKNTVCSEKLDDMIAQAKFGYTSFWLR